MKAETSPPTPPFPPGTPHILRRPVAALVFWDFDGTIYRAPAGCRRYGEEIARSLLAAQRGEYLARLDQYLARQGGIDAQDGWEAAVELAAQYPLADDGGGNSRPEGQGRWQEEFRLAREYLESGDCPLEVPVGLREAISRMRAVSRHVLVTNTPSFGVYGLLRRLGVTQCFDEVVCEAAKPALLPARLTATAAVYGLEMRSVLCVGDHFGNDIRPALACGAAAAYVNTYSYCAVPAGAADFEAPLLEAVLPAIERWVAEAAGAAHPARSPRAGAIRPAQQARD